MASEPSPVHVAVVHPLRMWVEALEAVLVPQSGLEPVVVHTDPRWVHRAVAEGQVDVVLIGLDSSDGAEPVRALRQLDPDVGVLVISDSDDSRFIADVVRAGARGYFGHDCSLGDLVRAVHGIHRGETCMRPHHVGMLVDGLLSRMATTREHPDRLAALTEREREILECLAGGLRRREIADRFRLSPNTVRSHIHNLLVKLEVHSTLAAVSLLRQTPGWHHGDDTFASGSP